MFDAEYCLTHAITHHRPKSDSPCSAVSLRQLSYLCVVCTDNNLYLLPRWARKGVKVPQLSADARIHAFFLDYEVCPFYVLILECFMNLDSY